MPATFSLVASSTLTGTAATVTFGSIPQTYRDLILMCSIRVGTGSDFQSVALTLAGVTTGGAYTWKTLQGYNTTVSSEATTPGSWNNFPFSTNGPASTSNTFSNIRFYIPNYAATANKQTSVDNAVEQNSGPGYTLFAATLLSNTTPVTTLSLEDRGYLFAAGSSFYLYGIKNS